MKQQNEELKRSSEIIDFQNEKDVFLQQVLSLQVENEEI
jgi:hypothetical protein